MEGLEDTLGAILGNQEMMGQIMALAQSLPGAAPKPEQWQPEEKREETDTVQELLRRLDPGMLQMGAELLQNVKDEPDRTARLLGALRPFLNEERKVKLDRALRLAPILRMMRVVWMQSGGEGRQTDV